MSQCAEQRISQLLLQAAHREGLLSGMRAVGGFLEWRGRHGSLRVRGRQWALGNRLTIDELPSWNGITIDVHGLVLAMRSLRQEAESPAWEQLAREMVRSVEVQRMAYAAAGKRAEPRSWEDFEAWTPEGHNLHPGAKTREGFSDEELRAYAPDFSQRVELPWIAVHKSLLRQSGELPEAFHLDDQYWAVPVHPWQRRHVLGKVYEAEWRDGLLKDLSRDLLPARLCTSLRTVHPENSEWPILKLSVGSLMTSTERSMSRHTVLHGPIYSQILQRALAERPDWARDVEVMRETGGLCWADQDESRPKSRQLSLLLRERLAEPEAGTAVPCSTLPQPLPGERTVLQTLFARGDGPLANLRRYCGLLIPFHIGLYQEWGLALEAHLQNCVVVWSKSGGPEKLWVRDWGGLRADPMRLSRRAADLAGALNPEAVTVSSDAAARRKLVACLYSNHLTEIVVGLARAFRLDERSLWATVEESSREALCQCPPGALRGDILQRPWPVKALLQMRLDPNGGDLYHETANPLRDVHLFGLDSARVAS